MATTLPEVPQRSKIIDDRGLLTKEWLKWFRDLYLRVGGGSANSLTDSTSHIASTSNPHSVTFTQAVQADSGTNVLASEMETLTDGSDADVLHTHSQFEENFRILMMRA